MIAARAMRPFISYLRVVYSQYLRQCPTSVKQSIDRIKTSLSYEHPLWLPYEAHYEFRSSPYCSRYLPQESHCSQLKHMDFDIIVDTGASHNVPAAIIARQDTRANATAKTTA